MTVEVPLPDMIETAIRDPVALVVGDEKFVVGAHSDATGRPKSRGERLKMSRPIGAVDPATPRGIVGHISTAFPCGFSIRDGEFAPCAEVKRGILPAEGIDDGTVVILVVFAGDSEGIGNAFVAITDAIFVLIDQAREFWLLGDVVGPFLGIVVDAVGLHEIFCKTSPGFVFVFPNLTFPGDDGEGVVGFVAEAENGHRALGQWDGFETIAYRDLGRELAGEAEKSESD